MGQILLVEDSRSVATLVQRKIRSELELDVLWAKGYVEAASYLSERGAEISLAILDLTLPDAPHGEIIDLTFAHHVSSIVFAANFSDALSATIGSKMVVDYILKDNPQNIYALIALIRRIERNKAIKVLVVDDSPYARNSISHLLATHQYQVLAAQDSAEALVLLHEHPDLKLVIVDYYMLGMDGLSLTKKIRSRFRKEEMAIIGLSARGDRFLPTRFIKSGANDFLHKPFMSEEFYCRVTHNIEMLENIETMKETANLDYLTSLYNRRYFFEMGKKLFASALRGHMSITVVMIDIDLFKAINDTHGHDAGDTVLKRLAAMLKMRFRETDIVSRYGGEEFCVLAANMSHEHTFSVLDEVRRNIEKTPIVIGEKAIHIRVSIGACEHLLSTLEEMITEADKSLYEAKQAGRNRVMIAKSFLTSVPAQDKR